MMRRRRRRRRRRTPERIALGDLGDFFYNIFPNFVMLHSSLDIAMTIGAHLFITRLIFESLV